MKNTLIVAFGLLVCTLAGQAGVIAGTNINTVSAADTVISSSTGAAYSGGIAAGGYFTTGFDVSNAIATNNFAALAANFNVVTSVVIGQTTGDLGANIAGYYNLPSGSYGAPTADLSGKQLYTFYGSAATLTASTAIGQQIALVLFSDTIGADTPAPDSNNLNLVTGGNHTVRIGTTGFTSTVNLQPVGGSATAQLASIRMFAIVPEPSTALLGAIGALGLLRRRR